MQKNATIALVDDSEMIRLTMSAILEDAGFIVHSFSCPTQLLQSNVLQAIDCLVTDFDMPVMDGCELQLHLKGRRPLLPIIFVTCCGIDELANCVCIDFLWRSIKNPHAS